MIWHSSSIEDIKKELAVNEKTGLSLAEISERIAKFGENKTVKKNKIPFYSRLGNRFTDTFTVIMLIAAAVMLVTGIISGNSFWYTPILIFCVLLINSICSALFDIRAEKELSNLKNGVSLHAKVMRDGEVLTVDAATLVPGDIMLLEQGDYIPADGRILEAHSLICDESAISGDTAPSEKDVNHLSEDICPVTERKNMVYSGCAVIYGYATVLVTDTGMNTEFFRQSAISEQMTGGEIPLKKKLKGISHMVSLIALTVAVFVFIAGLINGPENGQSFSDLVFGLIVTSAALTVAVLPEALPGAVIHSFSAGIKEMLDKKVITVNKAAVEALSEASVIISDKTGTLTKNKMELTMVYDGVKLTDLSKNQPDEKEFTIIRTGALCCNGQVILTSSGKKKQLGDPTEVGIVSACLKYCGLTKNEIENIYPRMDEVPFDAERKLMTTINMINNKPFAVVKGSFESVVSCCDAGNIKGAAEAAKAMGNKGLRVIALAIKPLDEVPSNPNPDNMECNLTLLGLFGMNDKVTKSTVNMVKTCNNAGIRTVMITGDQITTALAIADEIGIMREGDIAITGEELSALSNSELADKIERISVYSGINPSDKLRIVEAWQHLGKKVVVTGDSADDAEVLKVADVGCAMGVTGCDISKGSADLILTEDSYISIGEAIKSARSIYANIKRVVLFLLSSNLGEIIVMLLGVLIYGITPLSALPLLWINLITDFGPAIALSTEPAGKYIMGNSPQSVKETFAFSNLGLPVLYRGVMIGALSLIAFAVGLPYGADAAATMTFTVLALSQTVFAFALRSEELIIKEGIVKNIPMLLSVALSFLITLIIVLTPVSGVFSLITLSAELFAEALGLSFVPFLIIEVAKFIKNLSLKQMHK